jgi:hypothetical protein
MQVGPDDMLAKSGTRAVLAKIFNRNPGPAVAGRSHTWAAGLVDGLTAAAAMNAIRIESIATRSLLTNNKIEPPIIERRAKGRR